MTGRVTGEIGLAFVPVAGLVGKVGSAGRFLTTTPYATKLTRALGVAGRLTSSLRTVVRGAARCAHSFATTLVATAAGAIAISAVGVGDEVLAHDEASGTTGSYPVSAVHVNADPVTGTVVIAGEAIETTPEHPFYTLEAGWLDAADLQVGMHVPSAAGEPGVVEAVDFSGGPATMYNLTVEVAHAFFVGQGGWLVHNSGGDLFASRPYGHLTDHASVGRGKPFTAAAKKQIIEANMIRSGGRIVDDVTGEVLCPGNSTRPRCYAFSAPGDDRSRRSAKAGRYE